MGLRKLNHEILNEVDISKLLERFTKNQIALTFSVHAEYIDKCRIAQKIKKSIIHERIVFAEVTEDNLVCEDAWMQSKERDFMEKNFLLEVQNGES